MQNIYITLLAFLLGAGSLHAQNCTVDPRNYANTMSVVAVLNVEGMESRDSLDQVFARVGNECRGVASPVYLPEEDRYFAFLLVRSNATTNEEISFSVLDNSTGQEIPAQETLQFVSDARYGSIGDPQVFITDENKIPIRGVDAELFFSPNDDGVNDTWEIRNSEAFKNFEITILDAVGTELFTSQPYQNNWDGRYRGEALPADVYYYVLKSTERPEIFSGTISLIR